MISENIKILLIEDNPGDVRLIEEMLKEVMPNRFDMIKSRTLEHSMKSLQEQQFDVIILDLGLPDSQGINTFERLLPNTRDAAVIVVTGLADEKVGIQVVRNGAQDYLVKDNINANLLGKSLQYAIERKKAAKALLGSERLLKEAQALGKIGNWEFDLATQKIAWSDEVYVLYERDKSLGPPTAEEEAEYYSEEQAKKLREYTKLAVETGQEFEYDLVTKLLDGKICLFHASMRPVKDTGGRVVRLFGTVQDITERKRAEETLRKVIRALKTLSQCNEVLVRATDESELLQKICKVIVEVGGYRMAWVGNTEEDQKMTVRPMAQTGFENGYLEALRITWADTELDHSPIGTAIRTAKPCVCQDVFSDPGYTRWRDDAAKFGYVSLIALPLITDQQPFGALNIHDAEPDAFDDEEVMLLTELADDLAYGIKALRMRVERRKADEQLKQSVERLSATLEKTVSALASTAAKRDPYTAGHQQRVTHLAVALASEMGLPQDQIDGVRIAGLLHDIGKIAVPAEILSKPTRLTEAEFNIVKSHAEVGFEIIKGIEFPWPVAKAVLYHHERLNGSGYPSSLKGDDIIIEAKILAVADVVEAMASHRPYRPARGIDVALEEIKQNRGVLYDRAVVDACIDLFEKKNFKFD
ncbi:MAG TPA: HD domain-containing phosphohydrolase [bacterium]